MIMPTDISPELTTMSMMRNGKKITKPMMNAARNSERMKAGTKVVSETSLGVAGGGSCDTCTIKASSSGRVFASMKVSRGILPISKA